MDASRVDEDVERPPRLREVSNERFDRFGGSEVEIVSVNAVDGIAPDRSAERVREFARFTAARDGHPGALL